MVGVFRCHLGPPCVHCVYMAAAIRFYGAVGPRSAAIKYWWPDIAFRYALALRQHGLRMLALGAAQFEFFAPAARQDPTIKHWQHLANEFMAPIAERFVNIVCCPAGVPLGERMSAASFLPEGKDDDDRGYSYEPDYALHGLLTVGVRNIAITAGFHSQCDGTITPAEFSVRERTALKQYDAIITPYAEDLEALEGIGISARHLSAGQLHARATQIPAIAEVL